MADRADQWFFAAVGCPCDHFSIEHPQIFPAAAAAGHDDLVHLFALVQLPVQNANYAMLPLARQEFVAVYGQGVPPPEARSIGVEELREAPLMLSRRRDGGGGCDLIMRAFQDKGVRPNVVLDSQDTRLLHKLLRQGMSAVAILPEREVAAGTLESFPMRRLDVPGLDLAPVLIWLEHAYLSRTARRVIQCLHKVNADPGEQPDFEI